LPIYLKISGDSRFQDVVTQVKEAVLDAYENRNFPFESVVERLGPYRDMSRNPVVQVWFELGASARPGALESLHIAGAQTDPFDVDRVRTRFDLEMHIYIDENAAISGRLIYASDVLERSMVQQFERHYENFLRSAAANPRAFLSQIPIFDAGELSMVIDRWGASED
jgi:non-ribosomal peptide synthetase component F